MDSLEKMQGKEIDNLMSQLKSNRGISNHIVLLCHLYIDHLLNRYVLAISKNDVGFTGKNGLTFSNKIKFIHSIVGLNLQLKDGLNKLNDIRNDLAHQYGHEVSLKKIQDLGRTLGKDFQDIKNRVNDDQNEMLIQIGLFISGQICHATLCAEGYSNDV